MERQEIERIYPRDAFAEDRNRNARTESEIRHGLIVSPREVRRIARQAGEVADPAGIGFLAPFPEESYDDFADRVLALAEALEIPQGNDKKLQGLRQ
jgi:hypothetical protein